MKEGNLILNRDLKKWEVLDKDENGNLLSIERRKDKAAEIFRNQVVPKLIAANLYEENKTPSKEVVIKVGCQDLINATTYRGIPYNEIVARAGFKPNEVSELATIGQHMHNVCERIVLEHEYNKKNTVVNEGYVSSDKRSRCDVSIIINEQFRESIKNNQEIDKKVVLLNIDFYLGNSEKSFNEHSYRNYQNNQSLLILVPSALSGEAKVPASIPHHEKVRILGPDAFVEFLGIQGDLKREFLSTMKLANDATWFFFSRSWTKPCIIGCC